MNKPATAAAAIGVLILLIGVGLMVNAGWSAGTFYVDPEEKALWRGNSTSNEELPFLPDQERYQDYDVYMQKNSTLHEISIVDQDGKEILWTANGCLSGDWAETDDCQYDWVGIGEFDQENCPCLISFNSSGELLITENFAAGQQSLVDEWFGQTCAAIIVLCMGVIIIAVGGGIALFTKKKQPPQTQFVAQPQFQESPRLIQQPPTNQ